MNLFKTIIFITCLIFTFDVLAAPPKLLTPHPVIYLADNLDEQKQLGWFKATRGKRFSG